MSQQRPTAKNILDGIARAMRDAHEPLDEGLVLVPAAFDVLLHPEAYQELQSLMPRIRLQARSKLDAELLRLNSGQQGPLAWVRRLSAWLGRFLSADGYLRRGPGRAVTYERSGEAWRIEFGVTPEAGATLDHLVVEADFGAPASTAYRGHPTVNIRRRTTRLPDGRFETVLSTERPGTGTPTRGGKAGSTRRGGASAAVSADVLARLSYEDRSGRHVYYMKKEQVIIGRQDDPAHYLDVALDTLPDVSREHARIRHDPVSGAFLIKDLSQYGLSVDGRKIASSLNERDEDVNRWHPLPRQAEISLADAVLIHFEAL